MRLPGHPEPTGGTEGVAELLSALAGLPGNQRAAAILRWYAGYETDEIARMLGVSRATVRVHLGGHARRLRAELMEDDVLMEPDLKQLDELRSPDLRAEVARRIAEPSTPIPQPGTTRRRLLAGAVAVGGVRRRRAVRLDGRDGGEQPRLLRRTRGRGREKGWTELPLLRRSAAVRRGCGRVIA